MLDQCSNFVHWRKIYIVCCAQSMDLHNPWIALRKAWIHALYDNPWIGLHVTKAWLRQCHIFPILHLFHEVLLNKVIEGHSADNDAWFIVVIKQQITWSKTTAYAQLVQSQDWANKALPMDHLHKAWIHVLHSAIHGLHKSMLCVQDIHYVWFHS